MNKRRLLAVLGSALVMTAPAWVQAHASAGGGHASGGHASGGYSGGGHASGGYSGGGHTGGFGHTAAYAGGAYGGGARGYSAGGGYHAAPTYGAHAVNGGYHAGYVGYHGGYAGYHGAYGYHGYSTGAYWGGGYWGGGYWPRAYYGGYGFAWFLPILPIAYATYWYAGIPYYYANNVYYTWSPDYQGYTATDPPPVAGASGAAAGAAPAVGASGPADAAGQSGQIFMYPMNNQSAEQQAADRRECQQWAAQQTGQGGAGGSDYQRAMMACIEGRGYSAQ
jgi:hypothetical protein